MVSNEQYDIKEYTPELEELFVRFLISDTTIFTRSLTIIDPEHFEVEDHKKIVTFLLKYVSDNNQLPSSDILQTVCGVDMNPLPESECQLHEKWFLSEFEMFSRDRALEAEIYNSLALLKEHRHGEVLARVKRAVEIGLIRDLGTDPFDDPLAQIEGMRDNGEMYATGWRDLDAKLYGGVEKGTLSIFAGQSGTGKSLFLQNWGLNLVQQGKNVLYITLELSEKLTKLRLYAMISGHSTKQVVGQADDAATRISLYAKKHGGSIRIKQMTSHSTANDIRAYAKEYEIQTGIKVDAILVDYLDLLMPYSIKVNASDLFVKDKYISEELRNLAIDLHVIVGTASQLNRTSHDEIEFDHSHISGGISKINTADNVFAIFITKSMKESGRYQLQLLKTRSSAGVGATIDLKYDVKSMRIVNMEEGDEATGPVVTKSIVDSLKKKSVITAPKDKVDDLDVVRKGSKLRDMLKKR